MNADICLIPLTLRSGTIKGVESWESYKALRKAMRSGRDSDIRAVGKAIVKDMSDPKKAKAYNEGVQLAEQGARAAQIMMRDNGEIGKLMDEARKIRSEMKEDKVQMDAYVKKKEMTGEAHYRAVQSYLAKPSKDIAKQMNKTVQDYGKYKVAAEKYQKVYEKKKAEADRLYEQAMMMAMGKAKREMLLEVEQKRTRHRKQKEETKTPEEMEIKKIETTEINWKEEQKSGKLMKKTSDKSE